MNPYFCVLCLFIVTLFGTVTADAVEPVTSPGGQDLFAPGHPVRLTQPARAISRFTHEDFVDIADVPGHRPRLYEVHNRYPQRDLAFAGVAVTEMVSGGIGDSVNGSGAFTAYNVYSLEDGNKVFVQVTGTAQTDPGGARRSVTVENFVGGTGPFKGIRGQMRNTLSRAAGSDTLDVQVDGEYWFEQ
jgi:hypothetical protein